MYLFTFEKCSKIIPPNECLEKTHHCSSYAKCVPTSIKTIYGPNYSCECDNDYEGDGFYCKEIDQNPCTNGKSKCSENGFCRYDGFFRSEVKFVIL